LVDGAGVTIGGEVFVADGVLFINDRHPRAPRQPLPLLQLHERTRSYTDCIRLATFASESSSTPAQPPESTAAAI